MLLLFSFNVYSATVIERVNIIRFKDVKYLVWLCKYKGRRYAHVKKFMKILTLQELLCLEGKVEELNTILANEARLKKNKISARLYFKNLNCEAINNFQKQLCYINK